MDNNQNLAQPQERNNDQGNMSQIQQPGTPFRAQVLKEQSLNDFRFDFEAESQQIRQKQNDAPGNQTLGFMAASQTR
jgi:hypothetical protein